MLDQKTVIIVDCGIRTGSTMKSVLRAMRKVNPRKVIAAVPVTSVEGAREIATFCDELVYLHKPEVFVNAGYWYIDFRRPGESEVGDLFDC